MANNIDPVPRDVLRFHRDITLCVDIMFVNKIPFLTTLSRSLKFITVEALQNRQIKNVSKKIANIVKLYENRGFRVRTINESSGQTGVDIEPNQSIPQIASDSDEEQQPDTMPDTNVTATPEITGVQDEDEYPQ